MALLRPCATAAGFTATPERQRQVDMRRLRERVQAHGYQVVVDAGVVLILRRDVESSVYRDGKVLLKTDDRARAERAYDHLRPHLEAAWS